MKNTDIGIGQCDATNDLATRLCGTTAMNNQDLEKCLLTLLRRYNAADDYNKPAIAFYIIKLAAARSHNLK